jgi:hypothetical protein
MLRNEMHEDFAIVLAKVMVKDAELVVDSAVIDIAEEIQEAIKLDDDYRLEVLDKFLTAIAMATLINNQDVEDWDNDLNVYPQIKARFLNILNGLLI